jgi:hypothetical protein
VLIIPLLKVKYFSLGDYFSTGLCHNPSYVWRGLWGVKDYLLCGFKSSKSSGENIPKCGISHGCLMPGRIFPVSQQQLTWPNITLSELLASHAKQ